MHRPNGARRAPRRRLGRHPLAAVLLAGSLAVAAGSCGESSEPADPPATTLSPTTSVTVPVDEDAAARADAALLQVGDLPGPGWVDTAPRRTETTSDERRTGPLVPCDAVTEQFPATRFEGAEKSQQLIQLENAEADLRINEGVSVLPTVQDAQQVMAAFATPDSLNCLYGLIGLRDDTAMVTNYEAAPWSFPSVGDESIAADLSAVSSASPSAQGRVHLGVMFIRVDRAIALVLVVSGSPMSLDSPIPPAAADRLATAMGT